MTNYKLIPMNLTMFANANTNVTGDSGLTNEMKTFYSDYLIDLAEAENIHDQFGQKHPIPKNGGKIIEFRQYDPLPVSTTPLTEGVTPNGQKLTMDVITSEIHQYGGYVELSDMLIMTAIDNNLVEATKLIASQAGRTSDVITREILNGGTNVQYADGSVSSRVALDNTKLLTVKAIRMAVRTLKRMNAKKINGDFVGIIHPDVAYDLVEDPAWQKPNDYQTSNFWSGEIGKVAGVRFVENTEAKIFEKGGAASRDVYSTLILGADAYGVTSIGGGGTEMIVKQLGSAGTADPLNQRATVGWKLNKAAERLVEAYMVRIETCSSYEVA